MAKNIKNILFQLLVIFTLGSTCFSHPCSNNCYICFGENDCEYCYKTKAIKSSDAHSWACSTQPVPALDHCLVYFGDRCKWCEPGWALNFSGSRGYFCVPGMSERTRFRRPVHL